MSESNVLDNETQRLISGPECQRTKITSFEMIKKFISITNALALFPLFYINILLYFRNFESNISFLIIDSYLFNPNDNYLGIYCFFRSDTDNNDCDGYGI
jgi:hypothetical protein